MVIPRRFAWVLFFALTACGGGDDGGDNNNSGGGSYTVGSGTLTGTVGGQPWTLVSAMTDAFLSEGEPDFWVDLYQDTATCAAGPSAFRNSVIASVPRAPGRYPLSTALNATFVVEGSTDTENIFAYKGVMEVDSVSATEIQGGAHIEADAMNVVNGRFTIAVCP